MAEQYKDPWADTMNQAVGALYKHYLTRPSQADMAAAAEKLAGTRLENQMNQRLYDMGGYSGAPASVQEYLYTQSLGGTSDAAKRFENIYVTKPMQVDAGDVKYIVGADGQPIEQYGVGVAPKTEYDKEGNRLVTTPAVPSPNRPVTSVADAMMPYLIAQESGGNPDALSPKGAGGITQIMPDTARDPGYGVAPLQNWDGQDPRTAPVDEQMRFGRDYLGAMIDQRGGNIEEGLAAYNAGPGAVQQYGGVPPYAETQNYVQNIMGAAGQMPPQTVQNGVVVTNLPKSEADQNAETLRNDRRSRVTENSNINLLEIFPLLNDSALPVTGKGGKLVRATGLSYGTKVADIDRRINQLKAYESISALQQMREENKTGAAVGNPTEGELKILENAREAIDAATTEEDFVLALMRYYNLRNDIVFRADENSPINENHPGYLPTPEAITRMNTREELERAIEPFGDRIPPFVEQLVRERAAQIGLFNE